MAQKKSLHLSSETTRCSVQSGLYLQQYSSLHINAETGHCCSLLSVLLVKLTIKRSPSKKASLCLDNSIDLTICDAVMDLNLKYEL